VPWPHSIPPLIMSVTNPNPATRPAEVSAELGVYVPTITLCGDGILPEEVIQNHNAVSNAIVPFVNSNCGLLRSVALVPYKN